MMLKITKSKRIMIMAAFTQKALTHKFLKDMNPSEAREFLSHFARSKKPLGFEFNPAKKIKMSRKKAENILLDTYKSGELRALQEVMFNGLCKGEVPFCSGTSLEWNENEYESDSPDNFSPFTFVKQAHNLDASFHIEEPEDESQYVNGSFFTEEDEDVEEHWLTFLSECDFTIVQLMLYHDPSYIRTLENLCEANKYMPYDRYGHIRPYRELRELCYRKEALMINCED